MQWFNNFIDNTISVKDSIICGILEPLLFLMMLFFARVMFYGKKQIKSNFFEKILFVDLKYRRTTKYRVPESVFVINLICFIFTCLIYVIMILHIILFCQATSIIFKILIILYIVLCGLVYSSILYHYKLKEDKRRKRIHRH